MMNTKRMVEELILARNNVTKVGNNKYVITMAKAVDFSENYFTVYNRYCSEIDIEDITPLVDIEELEYYDFDNLGHLKSSYDTTFVFIDQNTLELKAFTGRECEKVVDLDWNIDEEIYFELTEDFDLYNSLALQIEGILKYKYNCREVNVQVIEGYYTRKEVLEMFKDDIEG